MNIFLRNFAKRIVIDAYPTMFIFSRRDNDVSFSIKTFIWLGFDEKTWAPLSIGEEIPEDLRSPDMHRFELFESEKRSPPSTRPDQDGLLQVFLEFGIGRCFERDFLPQLRPVVIVLGVDRFRGIFSDPRYKFKEVLKRAGASTVVFDATDF